MKQETADLSERELEILRLVATGASNKEIAQKLFISPNTVKVHLRNIFEKIGAVSRTEATLYAIRNGLSSTGPSIDSLIEAKSDPINITPQVIQNNQNQSQFKRLFIYAFFVILIALAISIVYLTFFIPERQFRQPSSTITSQSEPRWKQLADMPTARFGMAGAVYDNKIYAIGGETQNGITNVVEQYDPETDSWKRISKIPISVTDIQAAVINGKIYIPGGRTSSGMPTNTLEIFDPILRKWSTGAPIPTATSGYTLVPFDGNFILFGGWDGISYLSSVYLYNPIQDSWTILTSLPSPRAFAGAAVSGRKIFIVGGYSEDEPISEMLVFEPDVARGDGNPWTEIISIDQGRYSSGVTSVVDLIFIFGGKSQNSKDLSALVFSPFAREWQLIETPPYNFGSQLISVTLGPNIYSFGGVNEGIISNKLFSYKAIYTFNLPYLVK